METKEFSRIAQDIKYAGIHRLIELWKSRYLNFLGKIKQISRYFPQACNTTLLNTDLKKCLPGAKNSNLAVLQKSGISIPTGKVILLIKKGFELEPKWWKSKEVLK